MAHGDNPLVTETDEVVARSEMEKDADHSESYQTFPFDEDEGFGEGEVDDGFDPADDGDFDPYEGMTPEQIERAENEGDGYGPEEPFDEYNAGSDF